MKNAIKSWCISIFFLGAVLGAHSAVADVAGYTTWVSDLDTIKDIPGIEKARVIVYNGAPVKKIKKDTFNSPKLKNVWALDLGKSGIRDIEDDAFKGLVGLQYLLLNDNDLMRFRKKVFNDLPSLTFVSIGNNPLKAKNKAKAAEVLDKQIREQLPNVRIYSGTITRGAIVRFFGGAAVFLLGVFGLKYGIQYGIPAIKSYRERRGAPITGLGEEEGVMGNGSMVSPLEDYTAFPSSGNRADLLGSGGLGSGANDGDPLNLPSMPEEWEFLPSPPG